MKIKNKGKVYPSPSSSSSSSSSSSNGDYLSVLKLLPAAILALCSVLSLEDREVLAYLITRSIKTTPTTSTSSSIIQRKSSKKAAANGTGNTTTTHKPPVFHCDCFDCYTSYWFRWDSSSNRELIHQAIEAFEDHLTNGEREKSKKNNGKAKRRDKTARRFADKNQVVAVEDTLEPSSGGDVVAAAAAVVDVTVTSPENEVAVAPMSSPDETTASVEENEVVEEFSVESTAMDEEEEEERPAAAATAAALAASSCSSHKGLARKVLPDVLGLFNSRLWSLWNPNA